MIETLSLAALMLARATAPAPAAADERQWVCDGTAEGLEHETVTVGLQVDAAGRRLASYVAWSPPREPGSARADPPFDPPALEIEFGQASGPETIGEPTALLATVSALGGSPRVLRHKRVTLRLDDGMALERPLPERGLAPDYSIAGQSLRIRTASLADGPAGADRPLLRQLDTAQGATLKLLDRKGRVMAEARYRLTVAARERLFAEAWHAAASRAVRPSASGCTLADRAAATNAPDFSVPRIP